jgi:hypothetical protein
LATPNDRISETERKPDGSSIERIKEVGAGGTVTWTKAIYIHGPDGSTKTIFKVDE